MEEQDQAREFERRTFLKRAGVVAGATVWATPTIQSMSSAAFAGGSPQVCDTYIGFKYDVTTQKFELPSNNNRGDCQSDTCDDPDVKVPAGPGAKTVLGFTFSVAANDRSATITIVAPAGGSIESVNVMAKTGGGPAGPNTCREKLSSSTVSRDRVVLYFAGAQGAGLSNFAGCICVIPAPAP